MNDRNIKLYCGGRFYFNCKVEGYLDQVANDYRAILLGDVSKLLHPKATYMINEHTEYLGPFYFYLESEKQVANDIVAIEKQMLEQCTDAIFILDKGDCAGTVAELIYSSTLHKRIHIFYVHLSDNEETESDLHSPNWYPIILSKQLSPQTKITACVSREEAERTAIEMISAL